MGRHLLVINSHSGGGRGAPPLGRLLAGSCPGDEYETVFTQEPGHAVALSAAAASRCDTVIAVGGDGTVGEVATGLSLAREARAGLGILPAGTGNDIAHGLGISDWNRAVSTLRDGEWRLMDMFEACYTTNGDKRTRMALLGAGVGFPAHVIACTTERVKHHMGHWGYHYAAIRAALSYRSRFMRIETDGQVREGHYLLCSVMNMERTGRQSMHIAPGARWDDSCLNVVIARQPGRLRLLSSLLRVMKGTHIRMSEVEYLAARSIVVDGDPPLELMVDGECLGTTPARFTVRPGSLKVKVPRGQNLNAAPSAH